MGQFSNPVATYPRTNEVEVTPSPGPPPRVGRFPWKILNSVSGFCDILYLLSFLSCFSNHHMAHGTDLLMVFSLRTKELSMESERCLVKKKLKLVLLELLQR